MTVTLDTIRTLAPDLTATDEQIDTTLAGIDQDAAYAEERARWVSETWDRTSPINGVPADHFLARDDVSSSPVYLLRRDGQVVYFQPHQPDTAGMAALDPATIEEVASAHADEAAQRETDAQVVAQVLAQLSN